MQRRGSFFEPLWVSKKKREYASSVQQQGEIRKWDGLVVKKRARYTLGDSPEGRLLAFGFMFCSLHRKSEKNGGKSGRRLSDPVIPKDNLKVNYRQNPKPVVDCRFVE